MSGRPGHSPVARKVLFGLPLPPARHRYRDQLRFEAAVIVCIDLTLRCGRDACSHPLSFDGPIRLS